MMAGYLEPAGPRVALRHVTWEDEAEFLRLVRASTGVHHPWLQLAATPEEFGAFMARFDKPVANIGLLACERATGAIVGGININNIIHGRFQNGFLGYWTFAPAAGRGYMTEALGLVIGYAFGALGLHRLEANIQPANAASIRVVQRNGFRNEGYSPHYLFIDGAWRGHERWAITREMAGGDPEPGLDV
jgi:ribosomal-protein-alanine N-acetyltransferase